MEIDEVGRRLASLVEEGDATAAQVAVARDGDVLLRRSFGTRSPDPEAPPVTDASPFLVASISKPVTATAVVQCAERGLLDVDDPVHEHVPAFTGDGREDVTVRHLLTHTSGLPDMLPENEALRRRNAPLAEFVDRIVETPLRFEPGTSVEYQSTGIALAAEIVERATGTPLRELLRRDLFDPLGMDDTFLGLDGRQPSDLVQCDVEAKPGDPGHDRWDWNSAYWRDFGAPWGGLHSTADDLLSFLQAFLGGGAHGGTRILEPATVREMTTLRTGDLDGHWGLGWALRDGSPRFGEAVSPRTFGHAGATGTVAWADPERRAAFVCLTTKPLDEHRDGFFGDLSDAAVEALGEA